MRSILLQLHIGKPVRCDSWSNAPVGRRIVHFEHLAVDGRIDPRMLPGRSGRGGQAARRKDWVDRPGSRAGPGLREHMAKAFGRG
jgi:hypothetical protein